MTALRVDGHDVRLLALSSSNGLPRDPLGMLGVMWAQVRLRVQMLRGGRILQVHRPYRSLFLAGQRGPRVQFIQGNGWVVAERTANAVADGLEWVLGQAPERLREAALEAARPYTAAVVLERVYKI